VASLSLTPEELRELAEQLAPLIAVALSAKESTLDNWLDTRAAAQYAGCSVHSLRKATAAREVEFRQDADRGKCWSRREWIDAWRGGI
jgi:4'-phosphopantetheinyl transferase EntD